MQKMARITFGCFFAGALLVACSDQGLAHLEPDSACWKYSQALKAEIDHRGGPLAIPVKLCLTNDYPFSNMYLNVNISSQNGMDTSWTKNHTFIDALGNCEVKAHSGSYSIDHPVMLNPDLPAGKYTVKLGHNMRPERICGVESITILPN
jgi:gliding motility-associated lipoprotein GldH